MYYFRADGSAVTGAGHLMRCLTVAQELQKRIEHPEELCFLCAEQASAELLQSWNMQVKILGTDPADLEGELSALEGLDPGKRACFSGGQLCGDGCLFAGIAPVWQGVSAG
ncbi:MAG: hypothetical protein ACLR6I_14225 [Waltera sp.]